VYFWPRWRGLFRGSPSGEAASTSGKRFTLMLLLATACTGVVGLGLKVLIEKVVLIGLLGHEKGEIEHLFKYLPLIAASLFAVGILILVAGFRETKAGTGVPTLRSSILIGIVQGLCLPFR